MSLFAAASRKAATACLFPTAVTYLTPGDQVSSCSDATTTTNDGIKPFGVVTPVVALQKKMTSIGRFSLQTETLTNPSTPTFFLALSGTMTVPEFESTWNRRNMSTRHARFHSRVSGRDGRSSYFEQTPTDQRFASETMHFFSYRNELQKRIECLLLTPMVNVMERLWHVQISTGPLGSSGAIPIKKHVLDDKNNTTSTATTETLLLFQAHHALADGVSLIAALTDLCDESDDIQTFVRTQINTTKSSSSWWKKLVKMIQTLLWLSVGSLQALVHQGHLLIVSTRRSNPFLEACSDSGSKPTGRSISWCNAAPIEEVKQVAMAIGPRVTINDVFVSCVSAAVARQLAEHRERLTTTTLENTKKKERYYKSINVAIPVHLAGGIIPPGRGVGNFIGAFCARVPGEIITDDDDDAGGASERLKMVHSSLNKVKHTPAPILSYLMARVCSDLLPESWGRKLFSSVNASISVVITNSKGYTDKLHINGKTVETAIGFIPIPPGIPVGVVVQSYAGVVSLSVTAERWAVPDADQFLHWILDEYTKLCQESTYDKKVRK